VKGAGSDNTIGGYSDTKEKTKTAEKTEAQSRGRKDGEEGIGGERGEGGKLQGSLRSQEEREAD